VRWIVALAAASTVACASIGAPPGGPVRTTPPEVLGVTPDSGAVNVRARGVVFSFDVVTSDRELERFFLLSPQEGKPRVIWRRDRIEVRPRNGFRPNTAYSVTMLPGVTDLRGNTLRTSRTIIFSTGPTIPSYSVLGRVFDWMNERVAPKALIEVIHRPDSLPYLGVADSSGQFQVGPLDQGTYTVRAIVDNNNNRALDPTEPWDSVAVTVTNTSPFVELLAAPRDTIPPRLLTVTAPDTLTLVASFDRPLDPSAPVAPTSFIVTSADSARLRIRSVRTRTQDDAAQRAAQDSAAAARRDSIARSDTTRRDTTRSDSLRARPDTAPLSRLNPNIAPKPSRPAPPKELTIRLDSLTPMHPGTAYRVTALNMRGLLGRARTTERVITVPRPRVDTTKAPPPPTPPPTSPVRRPPPL
jgi:hypothetical protein